MIECKHLKYDGEGYCWECGLHYLDIIPVMQERIAALESLNCALDIKYNSRSQSLAQMDEQYEKLKQQISALEKDVARKDFAIKTIKEDYKLYDEYVEACLLMYSFEEQGE